MRPGRALRRKLRALSIGLIVAVCGTCRAFTQPVETATIPYENLMALKVQFQAIPLAERDHVVFAPAVLHSNSADHSPIHLWVMQNGQRSDIPLDHDGVVLAAPRPDWLSSHVLVRTDQPKHTLTVAASFLLAVPPGPVVSLSSLRTALAQTYAVMRSGARATGGYLAQFAVPQVRHVTITLAGCCAGTVTLATGGGQTVLHQDAEGHIAVPDAILAADMEGTLTASAPITKLDPS